MDNSTDVGGTMRSQVPNELVVMERADRMLAAATTLSEIKSIRDRAEAARVLVKAARLGLEAQNRAAVLKLRAERKAGAWLATLKLRGGDRRSKGHRDSLKLDELGISRNESKRWQREASISEHDFNEYVATTSQLGQEISAAGLMRFAHRLNGSNLSARSASRRGANATQCRADPAEQSEPLALIAEIENHRRLLTDVLRPLQTRQTLTLKRGERRAVWYLLSQIERLLKQLSRRIGN